MKTSTAKKKVIIISREGQHSLQRGTLEVSTHLILIRFTHQQCLEKIKVGIKTRSIAAIKLLQELDTKFISKQDNSFRIKMLINKNAIVPTLTDGSETQAMIQLESATHQTAEIKYLRIVEGKTRKDRIRTILLETIF